MSPANPKPQEPSMEEILASIRRIIADDQDSAKAPPSQEDPFEQAMSNALDEEEPEGDDGGDAIEEEQPAEEEEDDILDLADIGAASSLELEHEDISFRDADGQIDFDSIGTDEDEQAEEAVEELLDDSFEEEPEYEPAPSYPSNPVPSANQFVNEDRLISQATDAAVGSAFNALAHTVLSNNGRTLDDLVKEMLRPMLKVWLDDNLPTIVERLVRAEIERVSRGGR